MDNSDIRIHNGLKALLTYDYYLLANDLSERSITHKLAEHYQNYFSEWNVDCEYNRNLGDLKNITIDPKDILRQMADRLKKMNYRLDIRHDNTESFIKEMMVLEEQLRNPKLEYIKELDIVVFVLKRFRKRSLKLNIYPDIIIHHRGLSDNHIIIEAKKTNNTDRQARAYDYIKLMTLVSSPDFNYDRGYFIDLPIKDALKKFHTFSDSEFFSQDVYTIEPR